jgi:Protein of unknown function (DUF4238)
MAGATVFYVSSSSGVDSKVRWALIFSEETVFITSDNPVMITHPSLKFRGLKNPESTVSFPLSPTHILIMDNRHGEPDFQYYPLRQDPGSPNCLIWRNAIEHMFAPRHSPGYRNP